MDCSGLFLFERAAQTVLPGFLTAALRRILPGLCPIPVSQRLSGKTLCRARVFFGKEGLYLQKYKKFKKT